MAYRLIRTTYLAIFISLFAVSSYAQPDRDIRVYRDGDTASTPTPANYIRLLTSYNFVQISNGLFPSYLEYVFAPNKSAGIMLSPTFPLLVINRRSPVNLVTIPFGEFLSRNNFREGRYSEENRRLGVAFGGTFNYYFDDDNLPFPGKISFELRHRILNSRFFGTALESGIPVKDPKLRDNYTDFVTTYSWIPDVGGDKVLFECYFGLGIGLAQADLIRINFSQNYNEPHTYTKFRNSEYHILIPFGFRITNLTEIFRNHD